jgi:hypothetical protein
MKVPFVRRNSRLGAALLSSAVFSSSFACNRAALPLDQDASLLPSTSSASSNASGSSSCSLPPPPSACVPLQPSASVTGGMGGQAPSSAPSSTLPVSTVPSATAPPATTTPPVSTGGAGSVGTAGATGFGGHPGILDASAPRGSTVNTVILISVDGMAARYLEDLLEQGQAPTFSRLQAEGAYTHNARTEFRSTVTIPNHASMISSRPAVDVPGLPPDTAHGILYNSDPGGTTTLHNSGNPNLPYLTSVFDETHDRGGYTSLFSGKDKFALYDRSYAADSGRLDTIGEDNGTDKIDDFNVTFEASILAPAFLDKLVAGVGAHPEGPNFAMLHYRATDSQGHGYGWGSAEYMEALAQADQMIGLVLDCLKSVNELSQTALIVTTDHGGVNFGHFDTSDPLIYRIPFYVWGPGVPAGVDLYELSQGTRTNPGTETPADGMSLQPVRNGDSGNLGLWLLGLSPIPGSLHRGFTLGVPPPGCPPLAQGGTQGLSSDQLCDASAPQVRDAGLPLRDASAAPLDAAVSDAAVSDTLAGDAAASGTAASDAAVPVVRDASALRDAGIDASASADAAASAAPSATTVR